MKRAKTPTFLFAAGGTGGHIYPAIAVAEEIQTLIPEAKIVFAGTKYGLESRIVPKAGFDLETIDVRFLSGVSHLKRIKHALLLPKAGWQSWRLLSRHRPWCVVGAGGYASGPVVGMAALRGIPSAIMEQNAIPGITNKTLARFVDRIFLSFDEDKYGFDAKKVKTLGNPVRSMSVAPLREKGETTRVLVFGGSQGAGSLNEHIPRMLKAMGPAAGAFEILHQTGRDRHMPVRKAYDGVSAKVEVSEFIDDMASAYSWSDIIICRAGATTCAELKAIGRAAILVPFPYAAHNHQEENALAMVEAGAALMVLDKEMPGDRLGNLLQMCAQSPVSVQRMAQNALALGRPQAARAVAESCLELCDGTTAIASNSVAIGVASMSMT